jgi:hypothetical protein
MLEDEEEDEYIELDDQDLNRKEQDVESFSQRIMSSRPTTALKKDKTVHELPYPELFDRSERTFAATFAKFGDLSYYTPIQRIGAYMDFSQRLKKRHLMDLIAYMKTSKNPLRPADEEDTDMAKQDFLEACLFIGVMQDEDRPAEDLVPKGSEAGEGDN